MAGIEELQRFVDGFDAMTCVISVEKRPEGGSGTIRIVTGNAAYLRSIEQPAPGTEMLTQKFEPNSEYTRYLTRDLNFEDFCYRAAVEKKCLHSYVHPDRLDVWFNMTFLPLAFDEEDLCYCAYTMEISREASAERMSNISGDLASAVLETTLKLRGTGDFPKAMGSVIRDIRELCRAEYCCVLLLDSKLRRCSVLCEDFAERTDLVRDGFIESDAFYDLADSWDETIAGSNCLIVKNDRDMEVVRERNPRWHASLEAAGIRRIVLFPLKNQKELLGYIWATNFDAENAGTIKETMELTTFILGSEIANYLMLKTLRHLSSVDQLTGLRNRNEMNRLLTGCGEDPGALPLGVIFADLNGLKDVNDSNGHDEGDRLLRDAAAALREVFAEDEVFRVGGDEFTAILPGTTEEELAKRSDALRKAAAKYPDVGFSIGWYLEREGRDFAEALRIADERMYEDKKRYYASHPDKNRRKR